MTTNAKHPAAATTPSVVLFGIDSHGKPKAARFGQKHASLVNCSGISISAFRCAP